jgi:Flavin reductase like domain
MREMVHELTEGFKLALRKVAHSVAVVTARRGDKLDGMTATAVTSLCADPPCLLACVARAAALNSTMAECDEFCVNYLAKIKSTFRGFFRILTGARNASRPPMGAGAGTRLTSAMRRRISSVTAPTPSRFRPIQCLSEKSVKYDICRGLRRCFNLDGAYSSVAVRIS